MHDILTGQNSACIRHPNWTDSAKRISAFCSRFRQIATAQMFGCHPIYSVIQATAATTKLPADDGGERLRLVFARLWDDWNTEADQAVWLLEGDYTLPENAFDDQDPLLAFHIRMTDQLVECFIVAKLAGLSVRQLRRLEREGWVKPAVRTLGGMPLYTLSQVPAGRPLPSRRQRPTRSGASVVSEAERTWPVTGQVFADRAGTVGEEFLDKFVQKFVGQLGPIRPGFQDKFVQNLRG